MKSIQTLLVCFLASIALSSVRAADFQPEPGYVSLFNGHDLTGWGYDSNRFFQSMFSAVSFEPSVGAEPISHKSS